MAVSYKIAAPAGGALAMLLTLLASPAAASDYAFPIGYTGGIGAYPRSEPVYEARVGTALPEGAVIPADCYLHGEAITNPYGYTSDLWVLSTTGEYWPEVWLETGMAGVPEGLPACGSPPEPPAVPNLNFNRSATVDWALTHAMDAPPDLAQWTTPGCTWFVSQALWAGGLPQDTEWTSEGHNGRLRTVPGSTTAWNANDLYHHLQATFDVQVSSMSVTGNAVPEAEPGDVVAYDWENDGTIDHLALVTGIAEGSYPLVSEWGIGDLIDASTNYDQRGWTWSEKYQEWLQVKNPAMTAWLIHFQGGLYTSTY